MALVIRRKAITLTNPARLSRSVVSRTDVCMDILTVLKRSPGQSFICPVFPFQNDRKFTHK